MLYLNDGGELVEVPGPFIRTEFNYDMDAASVLSGLKCEDVTRTQQQFAEEVDINTIVRRFGLTGEVPESFRMPTSADYTEAVTDFHSAMNMIMQAEEGFMSLPAHIREKFENDPQRLLKFLEDDANIDAAREMGLVNPLPAAPVPMRVEIVQPAVSPDGPVPT